jgi:hypothetical protein
LTNHHILELSRHEGAFYLTPMTLTTTRFLRRPSNSA